MTRWQVDVEEFLAQAKTADEADELRAIFHFFWKMDEGALSQTINFETFRKGMHAGAGL